MKLEDKMCEALKPCPFCGSTPEPPDGIGTQYEIECTDCCQSIVGIRICDLMTIEERKAETFENYRYSTKYVERAKQEAIKRWNTRAYVNETPKNEHDSDDVLKRAPLVRLNDDALVNIYLECKAEWKATNKRQRQRIAVMFGNALMDAMGRANK